MATKKKQAPKKAAKPPPKKPAAKKPAAKKTVKKSAPKPAKKAAKPAAKPAPKKAVPAGKPYDTCNVDYIYLNKGRSDTDLYFPDRTISSSFTSLFPIYFAMPLKHFLEDIPANLTAPSVELYNLKAVNFPSGAPHVQPIDYTTSAEITKRINGAVSSTEVGLDLAQFPGADLPGLTYMTVTLNTLPDPSDFDPAADSIHIHLKYGNVDR